MRLSISIEKTEGAHPEHPPQTEGDFLLWRGISAARAVFATAVHMLVNQQEPTHTQTHTIDLQSLSIQYIRLNG